MRRVFITSLALSSFLLVGGCASLKEENKQLTSEKNALQSQVEQEKSTVAAANEKIANLEKELATIKGDLEAAKLAATTAQTEGSQKLKDAEGAADKRVAAHQAKMDAAAKESAADMKELSDKLAKATSDLTAAKQAAASQGAALSDRITMLEKKADDLTKQNEMLKAAAKSAPAPTAP